MVLPAPALTTKEPLPVEYDWITESDEYLRSGRLGCSLVAPSASSIGRLGISPTTPLSHQPVSFVSVSDAPKPVYPLSGVPPPSLEALNPLTSTDQVDVHQEKTQFEDVGASEESLHGPLDFRIPKSKLREIRQASLEGKKIFWQYTLYQGPGGKTVEVHYCQSKEASERIAQLFLDQEVVGFDIEWKQHASANDGIRKNVALVQLASEERIALFHIARYSAGDAPEDLVAPSLQKIMESPNITKAGVAIKGDCTRLRRHMRIDSRGLLELSHLYKLVRFSTGDVKQINKKLVTLAQQVEEHLKLPLWKGEVRNSDWTKKLDNKQIEYAASDSYAGLQLFYALEGKRKALSPSPPRPSHAELNLPIQLANNETISTDDEPLEVSDEGPSAPSCGMRPSIEEMACEFLNVAVEDSAASEPVLKTPKTKPVQPSASEPRAEFTAAKDWEKPKIKPDPSSCSEPGPEMTPANDWKTPQTNPAQPSTSEYRSELTAANDWKTPKTKPVQLLTSEPRPEFTAANDWITRWRATHSSTYKPRVMPSQLRAYALWHEQQLDVTSAASILRDPPLKDTTVAAYILESLTKEGLPFQRKRITEVVEYLSLESRRRYSYFLRRIGMEV
ncbi:hypothetical protein MMC22_001935 [Lobaria immixta]|nr:hypothetical protein [Lobaria immixta]